MTKYLKGWLMPVLGILFFLTLVKGGWWMWAPFLAAVVLFVVGDALLPRDDSEPPRTQIEFLLNLPLYLILPLLCLLNFTVLWMFGSGDVLGFGVETINTDAGQSHSWPTPYPCHTLMHGAGKYGLQCLTHLDQLPPTGALILAAPLKILEGSGSPLRVLALVQAP